MIKYQCDTVSFDLIGRKANFFGDPTDDYFKNLAAHSAQNGLLHELMKKFLIDGGGFIDVGANIGITARAARIISPKCNIYCLEPSPKAYFYLTKNADPDWLILNCGAGSKQGAVDFCESDFLAGSSIELGEKHSRIGKNIIQVPLTTLDSVLIEKNIHDSRLLVKIDVEGFELDVLRGADELALKPNVLFVAEFNSYAISANGRSSPFVFLEKILSLYGKIYGVRENKKICIKTDKEMRDFFYQNMVTQGCVEDIFFGSDTAISMVL
jgi:FkbM family methyltransferase